MCCAHVFDATPWRIQSETGLDRFASQLEVRRGVGVQHDARTVSLQGSAAVIAGLFQRIRVCKESSSDSELQFRNSFAERKEMVFRQSASSSSFIFLCLCFLVRIVLLISFSGEFRCPVLVGALCEDVVSWFLWVNDSFFDSFMH